MRFAPLPTRGIWTTVGLERVDFLVILLGACGLYFFWGGPLWSHLGQDDFTRIAVSYTAIPAAVLLALWRRGRLTLGCFLAASGIIAALKLLITACLALVFDLAGAA